MESELNAGERELLRCMLTDRVEIRLVEQGCHRGLEMRELSPGGDPMTQRRSGWTFNDAVTPWALAVYDAMAARHRELIEALTAALKLSTFLHGKCSGSTSAGHFDEEPEPCLVCLELEGLRRALGSQS